MVALCRFWFLSWSLQRCSNELFKRHWACDVTCVPLSDAPDELSICCQFGDVIHKLKLAYAHGFRECPGACGSPRQRSLLKQRSFRGNWPWPRFSKPWLPNSNRCSYLCDSLSSAVWTLAALTRTTRSSVFAMVFISLFVGFRNAMSIAIFQIAGPSWDPCGHPLVFYREAMLVFAHLVYCFNLKSWHYQCLQSLRQRGQQAYQSIWFWLWYRFLFRVQY